MLTLRQSHAWLPGGQKVKFSLMPRLHPVCVRSRSLVSQASIQLASFPAKLKQPVCCISPICSYMLTFLLKVNYKVIDILAVRWLGTRLMYIFKNATTSAKSWVISKEQQWSVIKVYFTVFHCFTGSWEGLRMSAQARILCRLYSSVKQDTRRKFVAALCAFRHALRGTARSLHFKFAPTSMCLYHVGGLYTGYSCSSSMYVCTKAATAFSIIEATCRLRRKSAWAWSKVVQHRQTSSL